MAFLEWNDNLSVNIAQIDQQHQKLIGLINELHNAMKKGKGKEILGKIVDSLANYTITHFKTEEDYFAKFEYPDADSHIQEHVGFIQEVSDFKKGLEEGKFTLTVKIMNFLSNWLKNHIMGTDKKYSSFFNDRGLR